MSPEQPTVQAILAHEGALEGESQTDAPKIDPDLAQVVTAWANLPQHIRATILTLVNSSKEAKQ